MRFVSYAQNYEDVMLKRAFGNLKFGFYVDVGAHHPVNDSVTHDFYKIGWHGINIEPMQLEFDLLTEQRPRDINLQLAKENLSLCWTFMKFWGQASLHWMHTMGRNMSKAEDWSKKDKLKLIH